MSLDGKTRITIRVFTDDYEWYKRTFPSNYNFQIRQILRNWREKYGKESKSAKAVGEKV